MACDIDPPARESDAGPDATPTPAEDADLVAGVVASLVRAQAALEAASLSVPTLGLRLQPVGEAHAAHLDLLAAAVPDSERPTAALPTVGPRPGPALSVVRRSEQRLLREVHEACTAASSGDLARVLASIAASTAQHGATLAAPFEGPLGVPGATP